MFPLYSLASIGEKEMKNWYNFLARIFILLDIFTIKDFVSSLLLLLSCPWWQSHWVSMVAPFPVTHVSLLWDMPRSLWKSHWAARQDRARFVDEDYKLHLYLWLNKLKNITLLSLPQNIFTNNHSKCLLQEIELTCWNVLCSCGQ